jgi:acetyl esterase/lipase
VALSMDPQVLAAMAPLMAMMAEATPPPAGDWQTRRQNVDGLLAMLAEGQPTPTDVKRTEYELTTADGGTLALRWYTRNGQTPGSAVLYLHGGGMILGSLELYDPTVARYVSASGVPMLQVEYRLAPEHPHPTPVEDCSAALGWLVERAAELGVDPARIAVMGDSAGAGLAAGVALLARDRGGPALSRQVLIYPMLDDRTTTPDPEIAPYATWTYDDNVTGWDALLGEATGTDDVSPYAAPARATELAGLPPAYIEVGELDAFRDEDVGYARRLAAAGVSTELHVHPGCPHAFEAFAPESDVARRSTADRVRVLRSL